MIRPQEVEPAHPMGDGNDLENSGDQILAPKVSEAMRCL